MNDAGPVSDDKMLDSAQREPLRMDEFLVMVNKHLKQITPISGFESFYRLRPPGTFPVMKIRVEIRSSSQDIAIKYTYTVEMVQRRAARWVLNRFDRKDSVTEMRLTLKRKKLESFFYAV